MQATGGAPNRILGRYRLLRRLGAGGMGTVYEAVHMDSATRVAFKVLSSRLKNERHLKRFHLEAESLARLDHPAIIDVLDAGVEAGVPYIAMEYIEGESVGARLLREKRLSIPEACRLVHQAAEGLAHAHDQGIIHRDIKPDNLLIADGGRIKIIDFGLVKVLSSKMTERITLEGSWVGTPQFMSPEQWKGAEISPRCDIYSLGVTFYVALVGGLPYEAKSLASLLVAQREEDPRPIRTLRPDVPNALAQIVDAMIAREPEARLASTEAVADRIADFIAALPAPEETARVPCPGCETLLQVPMRFFGKQLSCRTCHESFTVNEGPTRERKQLARWERAILEQALERNLVDSEEAQRVLARREAQLSDEEAPHLAHLLVRHRLLSRSSVRELARGLPLETGVPEQLRTAKAERDVRCPNCFGPTSPDADVCDFCDEFLGEYELKPVCPNCDQQQEPGTEVCETCGADMETGIRMIPCPGCDDRLPPDLSACPSCGEPLSDESTQLHPVLEAGHRLVRGVYEAGVPLLILILLVLGAWWFFRPGSSLPEGYFPGTDARALRRVAFRFAQAIENEEEGLTDYLVDPALRDRLMEAWRLESTRLRDVAIQDVRVDGNRAVVEVELVDGSGKKRTRIGHWIVQNGAWFFQSTGDSSPVR